MNNYYIYNLNYRKLDKVSDCEKLVTCTVIFCDREIVDEENIKSEITRFYSENHQTDEVYAIGCHTICDSLKHTFLKNQDNTFKGIPKRQDLALSEHFYLLTYDKDGEVNCCNDKIAPEEFLKVYKNEGLQNIFIKRGGLINSSGSHHYVFPSKKHCDSFLRTGNILLVSSEIYFIAFTLLKHFDFKKHSQIYCDTSSINSVAFALIELKNRFQPPNERKNIPIESFSSYDGLYSKEMSYVKTAFLIISASTSTNILAYILDRHTNVDRRSIVVMYYLGDPEKITNIKDQLLCNLTKSIDNPNGLLKIETEKEENCKYCLAGSHPIMVSGDVFLLENPKINRLVFKKSDAEKYVSSFVSQFKSKAKVNTVLKVNYKEVLNPTNYDKYDIYIDFEQILDGLESYPAFKKKINNYINQFVPSNLKYIIYLNDSGSKKLAEYIRGQINSKIEIISQDDISTKMKNEEGAVLVVGSCIANGKNLLYISRALRLYDKLRIVYFIGISRTKNQEFYSQLKLNLKQGIYGGETNTFVDIYNIFCNNSKKSSWKREVDFLKDLITDLRDNKPDFKESIKYFENRQKILNESEGKHQRGLANSLFYPWITKNKETELAIRKNFAFFDFQDYVNDVSQSDIYFTISNVLHGLRNSSNIDRNLKQSPYIRNIIDPANFSRFNDGIIQASILRTATAEELAYKNDVDLSEEMYETLETLINYYDDPQGEALLEFLYAIAIEKLTLRQTDLGKMLDLVDKKCDLEIFQCFAYFIREKILNKKVPEIKNDLDGDIPIEAHDNNSEGMA